MKPSPKFACGMTISMTEEGHVIMKQGRNGSCEHASAEAIARLINIAPREKVIKQLSHINCKHGIVGFSSCFDFISKMLHKNKDNAV